MAQKGDPIPPFDQQVCPQEQDFFVVGVGHVFDHHHLPTAAGGRGKAEMQRPHRAFRGFDALHLIQHFFAAFGLGAAGGAGPEFFHKGFLLSEFLLLPLVGAELGRLVFLLLPQVGAVVAQVGGGDAALGFHNLGAETIQKFPVVGDDYHRRGQPLQVNLQPFDGVQIQVVRRFVHQQDIRLLQQNFA